MSQQIAYFLLCHKNPGQVARLVRRLSDSNSLFIIHVDRRAGSQVQHEIQHLLADFGNVYFAKRHACYWGKFGIVKATLSCIESGLKHQFDRGFLISGQDYPIKSSAEIQAFFKRHPCTEFIESFPLREPNRWSKQGGPFSADSRASKIYLSFRSRTISPGLRIRSPLPLEPYGGSQWWCLTRSAIELVSAFTKVHPLYMMHASFKSIPDEQFFQTILSNSSFESRISDTLTFADWDALTPPFPRILDLSDLNRLRAMSNRLVARKFEPATSDNLIKALDAKAMAGPLLDSAEYIG